MDTKNDTQGGLKAEIVEVGVEQAGQRIDNFLIKHLKGVPKTRLYRALRGGEVRVNGARKKAPYQLCVGDRLRIPPIRRSAPTAPTIPARWLEKIPVLYEDASLLVVDKPAGLAVHGGTGMRYGLIEVLRALRTDIAYLELAHRLDRETSGCLMLAKSRVALLGLQAQLGQRRMAKIYVALICGAWHGGAREIDVPLVPRRAPGKQASAKKLDPTRAYPQPTRQEQPARSIFSPRLALRDCTLVDIRLVTGRMHQARLHAASINQPMAGDRAYGDPAFNRRMKDAGLRRLFLHAEGLRFRHPITDARVNTHAPLPPALVAVLDALAVNPTTPL